MVGGRALRPASVLGLLRVALLALCAMGLPPHAVAEWYADGEPVEPMPVVTTVDGELLADEPFLVEAAARPRVSARLGAVILQRARPQSEVFMYNPNTGATVLNPDDLDFPFQGGVDAGLVWRGSIADLEVRYFGVEDSRAQYGPVQSGPVTILNIPGVEPFLGTITTGLTGTSSLQSVEINLRRNVTPRLTWLAGFRYVSFRDAMGVLLSDGADAEIVTFGTRNELFGLQFGGDAILWQPSQRFHIESALKAGVYANAAGNSLTSNNQADPTYIYRRRDNPAFVGDLNFVGVYQLNRYWAVRAGYQLLWLSGVAVGSMQFHDMNFEAGMVRTNLSATVFYHGALVGLERSW